MERKAKLLQLVREIAVRNDVILSGSLALDLQGIKLTRTPKDIDLVLPFNLRGGFKPIQGMEKQDLYDFADEYDNEDDQPQGELNYGRLFDIVAYTCEGVKIDIFFPNVSDLTPSHLLIVSDQINVPILKYSEIMRFKIEHAFGHAQTAVKHQNDILRIMNNIKRF